MVSPYVFVAQIFTKRADDANELGAALDALSRSFDLLWNRKVLAPAVSAVGFIEVSLTTTEGWNVHLHVILDAAFGSIDLPAANVQWRKLIPHWRAGFSMEKNVRSREGIATYISKIASYAPSDGRYTVPQLEALLLALHRRRLPVIRRIRRTRRRLTDRSATGI